MKVIAPDSERVRVPEDQIVTKGFIWPRDLHCELELEHMGEDGESLRLNLTRLGYEPCVISAYRGNPIPLWPLEDFWINARYLLSGSASEKQDMLPALIALAGNHAYTKVARVVFGCDRITEVNIDVRASLWIGKHQSTYPVSFKEVGPILGL